VRALNEQDIFVGGDMTRERRRIGRQTGYGDRILDMKLAPSAIIVEAVRRVRVLLNLDQRQPAADRVDGARRDIIEVASADRAPVEQLFD
jgi:hypothetical protein